MAQTHASFQLHRLVWGAALLLAVATGCGGGSSGGGSMGGPPPTIPPGSSIVLKDGNIVGADNTFTPVDDLPSGNTPSGGQGQPVDGMNCGLHNIAFHIHIHLSLFVNGTRTAIPDAIGLFKPGVEVAGITEAGTKCFYPLHTHDAQGLIHVEAPAVAQFSLGEFFDIWGQPLSANNVAGKTGTVQIYIAQPISQGSLTTGPFTQYTGDPRAITVQPHEEVVLEVGPPFVPPSGLAQIIFEY